MTDEYTGDGGAAYPIVGEQDEVHSVGMTLRDYFASHASDFDVQCALEDLGRSGELNGCLTAMDRNAVARMALGDAMLRARKVMP